MYRKFKHLNIPDGWEQYWSKYPNGYTIMESLIDWISQVNDMIINQNELTDTVKSFGERIDEFINQFGAELQKEVQELLTEWQTSGFLDVVISEALQWQLDDYIATNEQDKLLLTEQLQQTVPKVHEELFATDFGAVGDGVADDTIALEQALQERFNQNKRLRLDAKDSQMVPVYRITRPLVIKARTQSSSPFTDTVRTLRTDIYGVLNAIIKKEGSETHNGIDCVVYVDSDGSGAQISDLDLSHIEIIGTGQGDYLIGSNTTKYGIYFNTPVMGGRLQNILVRGCDYGVYNNKGMFMTTFDQVRAYTKEYGLYINGGTSLTFIGCYCQLQQKAAYRIYSVYSSMIGCGADGVNGISYDLYYCTMTLIGCGSENGWGETVYNITGGNVTVTNGFHLVNYNFDEAVAIKARANAYVVFDNTKFTTVLNDSVPEKVAFGKLFTIESNAYIDFNNCKYPTFNLDSNWTGNARTKLLFMKNNESTFYSKLMKPLWRFNNDYVDGSGLFAFDKTVLDGSIIPTYTETIENSLFSTTNTSEGISIIGTNTGSSEKYAISIPFDSAKNFTTADITFDLVSTNTLAESGRGAYIRILIQSKEQLGTEQSVWYNDIYSPRTNSTIRFSNLLSRKIPNECYVTFVCIAQPWASVEINSLNLTIKKIRFYDL